MKKIISILVIFAVLFLVFEWGINFIKDGHEVDYKVFNGDKEFSIVEMYQKENGDSYDIKITSDGKEYHYVLENKYNKQKQIIESIEYFGKDTSECIYPVLNNGSGTYLQCFKDGKLYSSNSYSDKNFISMIDNSLKEKGFNINKVSDTKTTKKYNTSTIYENNLLDDDVVVLWVYKGINSITKDSYNSNMVLGFDKYNNDHGYLVNNYYVVPNYLSSRVLEFSSVTIINLNDNSKEKIQLGYSLSSDTYINGVVDGKLYYTDPSNLLQIEINFENKKARLIGSVDLGGQIYDGNWNDANIYDFVSKKIKFDAIDNSLNNYSYNGIIKSDSSYYFYNNNGEVYQVSNNYLDKPILLFKMSDINNFNVSYDTIYFVSGDTLYYYSNSDGLIPVLKNSDLKYNKSNRISVYRKS